MLKRAKDLLLTKISDVKQKTQDERPSRSRKPSSVQQTEESPSSSPRRLRPFSLSASTSSRSAASNSLFSRSSLAPGSNNSSAVLSNSTSDASAPAQARSSSDVARRIETTSLFSNTNTPNITSRSLSMNGDNSSTPPGPRAERDPRRFEGLSDEEISRMMQAEEDEDNAATIAADEAMARQLHEELNGYRSVELDPWRRRRIQLFDDRIQFGNAEQDPTRPQDSSIFTLLDRLEVETDRVRRFPADFHMNFPLRVSNGDDSDVVVQIPFRGDNSSLLQFLTLLNHRRMMATQQVQETSIEVINSVTRVSVVPEDKGTEEADQTCAICICDYEAGDSVRHLRCNHFFHTACADKWLALNRTCPVCRMDIQLSESR